MAGSFKVDPDLGEIVVGRGMERLGDGNHTFEVSATNGLRTVSRSSPGCLTRSSHAANVAAVVSEKRFSSSLRWCLGNAQDSDCRVIADSSPLARPQKSPVPSDLDVTVR
ncbi:unnamed protein product [Heligmosomoides polygyrus]|uniref:Cadherin domain-containing protein n=1 Tax=Heligmosomoides polygyrus TaxID=6339 RepID=A0A183FZ23_HELPZ|nr:unnamed protein product [Heligmosomoides polygyrus]